MAGTDVEAVCAEMLAGLDEDTLEYVVSTIADEDDGGAVLPADELVDFLAPMLVDAELCPDDATAEELCAALWGRLTGGGAAAAAADEPVLLSKKVSVMDDAARYEEAAKAGAAVRSDLKTLNSAIDVDEDDDDGGATQKSAVKAVAAQAALMASVEAETAAVEAELEAATRLAAQLRLEHGAAAMSAIECSSFDLPNPGGGANLLDSATFNLAPGHRYALIGRNGKGKSTLLRWLAARRVGGLPANLSVHYVSQEVTLTDEEENSLPAAVVLAADVERRLLLVGPPPHPPT